jgi:hypothetical protein
VGERISPSKAPTTNALLIVPTFKNAFPFNEITPPRARIDESNRSLAGSVNEAAVAIF